MSIKYYKLTRNGECLYVGITSQKYLCNRLANHKQGFSRWKSGDMSHGKLFYYSDDFSFDGVKIELIEEVTEELTLDDKRIRENHWITQLNPTQSLNKIKNPNYQKEWWQENKAYQNEKKKEYYQTTLKQRQKERVECPICSKEMAYSSLSRHKSRKHKDK